MRYKWYEVYEDNKVMKFSVGHRSTHMPGNTHILHFYFIY